jgi:tetratricopeptide (TPR) repeat protein
LLLAPTSLLANLYHFTDQNAAAAEQAQKALSLARITDKPLYQALNLQILSLSQFFAYQSLDAEKLLEESIAIAQKHQGHNYVVQGYTYLGVISTEHKEFLEAAKQFEQALESIKLVSDAKQKAYLEFTVKGYYARSQALAKNIDQAITLYNTAIARAQEAGVQQYLALSQLHYGLAICLAAKGDKVASAKITGKAEVLEEEAYKRCEIINTGLSFSIMRKTPKRCY